MRGETSPLGTEKVSQNGYTYVKTASGWKLKHHVIWSEANGDIPINHQVVFDDGNRTNFDPDNLRLREVGKKSHSRKSAQRELWIIRRQLENLQLRLEEVERSFGSSVDSTV